MRRHEKVKAAATRESQRRTVTSATAAARRTLPSWMDASDATVAFPNARSATPRVRDGLVLRSVSKRNSIERSVPHGSSSR